MRLLITSCHIGDGNQLDSRDLSHVKQRGKTKVRHWTVPMLGSTHSKEFEMVMGQVKTLVPYTKTVDIAGCLFSSHMVIS